MSTVDRWTHLRQFTGARIAMGRAGGSAPTGALLDFRLAHARARDAVHTHFDPEELAADLRGLNEEALVLDSLARDRAEYLQRPDFGRRLSETSRELLEHSLGGSAPDITIIVSDGLSTTAAMQQAGPTLAALLPLLRSSGWTVSPLLVVRHARVAIQDEIGGILSSVLSLILLGERPGARHADSLGAYFTYLPVPGRTDADRNCVSNIRPLGLPPAQAASKLHALLLASKARGLSGVNLKDETALPEHAPAAIEAA